MKEYSIQELADFINAINHADKDAAIEIKQSAGNGQGIFAGGEGFTVKIKPVAHVIAEKTLEISTTDSDSGDED